jgi:hypothetical protein
MTEQGRQASDIICMPLKVIVRKGVPERMSTRLLGKVDPTRLNEFRDHLRDC